MAAFFKLFFTKNPESRLTGADTNHLLKKDEDSDNVVCHICLEMYDKPQVLMCGHSLCKDCIDRMLSATTRTPKVVSCPICRIETTVPETGLAPNYELEKALESFLRKKNMLDKNRVCHERIIYLTKIDCAEVVYYYQFVNFLFTVFIFKII
uniref:RING-type domain-containing protein n=1 Tax=Rhabditophanes sp. KR3021 TaxID=114890 RepID=A0AC35U2G2_9BILA